MRVYFLFFCLCFLTSCLNVKELEYKGFNDISFSKKNGCNPFCIYLDVYNPNNFKINLKSGNGDALIDSHNIGEIRLANTTKLVSNQVTTVELTIITESEKFLKALFNSLEFLMGKQIDLQIIGEIKAKVFGIGKKVKFNEHHKLSLKDLNN